MVCRQASTSSSQYLSSLRSSNSKDSVCHFNQLWFIQYTLFNLSNLESPLRRAHVEEETAANIVLLQCTDVTNSGCGGHGNGEITPQTLQETQEDAKILGGARVAQVRPISITHIIVAIMLICRYQPTGCCISLYQHYIKRYSYLIIPHAK